MSPLFLVEVIDAWYSSTLSNSYSAISFSPLDSAVSFSSLKLLSLVILLSSLTQYQSKCATSLLRCWIQNQNNLLIVLKNSKRFSKEVLNSIPKRHVSRTCYHVRKNWLMYQINLVTWVPVYLNLHGSYLTTIHWPLKDDQSFNAITSTIFL